MGGAAREHPHLHCTPSLPQGRSEPVFEEVPIVQMTEVIDCFDMFEYQLDPETARRPSLSTVYCTPFSGNSLPFKL